MSDETPEVPPTLTEQQISSHFSTLGYTNIQITKPWRYFSVKAVKDSQAVFIKVASESNLNNHVLNEEAWYRLFETNGMGDLVPKVIESGEVEGFKWYACEYIEGSPLSEREAGSDTALLEQNLDEVVNLLKVMNKISEEVRLPLDSAKMIDLMFERSINWSDKLKEEYKIEELQEVIDFLNNFDRDIITFSLSHGDFTPWHIIKTGSGLKLIDAEHGSYFMPKMHDAAYFFHRVFGTLENPELAKVFIRRLESEFNEVEMKLFKLNLARKIVGGIWEAMDRKWIKLKYQLEMLSFLKD